MPGLNQAHTHTETSASCVEQPLVHFRSEEDPPAQGEVRKQAHVHEHEVKDVLPRGKITENTRAPEPPRVWDPPGSTQKIYCY